MGYFKSLTDRLNDAEFPDPYYKPTSSDLNIKSISFCHNIIFVEKGNNPFPSNMRSISHCASQNLRLSP